MGTLSESSSILARAFLFIEALIFLGVKRINTCFRFESRTQIDALKILGPDNVEFALLVDSDSLLEILEKSGSFKDSQRQKLLSLLLSLLVQRNKFKESILIGVSRLYFLVLQLINEGVLLESECEAFFALGPDKAIKFKYPGQVVALSNIGLERWSIALSFSSDISLKVLEIIQRYNVTFSIGFASTRVDCEETFVQKLSDRVLNLISKFDKLSQYEALVSIIENRDVGASATMRWLPLASTAMPCTLAMAPSAAGSPLARRAKSPAAPAMCSTNWMANQPSISTSAIWASTPAACRAPACSFPSRCWARITTRSA